MDTREKIRTFDQITADLEQGSWSILAGEFDPLTADLAAQIAAAKRPGFRLLMVVREGASPLFDVQARLVLLAALRCVDAVIAETEAGPRLLSKAGSLDAEFAAGHREHFEMRVLASRPGAATLERKP